MKYLNIEESYLTYLKLFDGLDIPFGAGRVACDLSFNDYITAKYLVNKKKYSKVYSLSYQNDISYKNIYPLIISSNIAYTLSNIKSDFIISLGGDYFFRPLYDVIFAISRSLYIGGKFLIAVYPDVFDESGRDVLGYLSNQSSIPVKERFNRWFVSLKNALTNIFVNIKTDEVIQDVSVDEIKRLFCLECFYKFVFNSSKEYEKFFHQIDDINKKVYLGWNIISGFRV